ncbi:MULTISPECIES: hypothetical protein [unclassified Pseudomonas]|uniref:hypothetical protein n=1 Tax=unclassified Pseudomonas TaxID=196821 RepID=UPI000C88CC07|nr:MULTISPECIES: hypothetical protein [unclassified Pseudomonas]PMZ72454.1 hypothetical protein C1X25_11300 [Pseudomonas sp. GW247-3R2A]PMY73081.1 hypothetical protein C1X26_12805 [Pseudomonas sp. MPR-R3A]PMY97938.1 hypothetical protein C1X24_12085 [Pseudomonas sp. FW305-124]PNA91763.1 hypothetical protein C1X23_16730 [Pseudomonas sp. FW300-E2]PNB02855.1 hypothetical protein C1X27_11340 [Pseudomonas sp. MPR-AND1B]
MFLAALFFEEKGLDPVEKYFLVRFIQCFGTADPAGLSVKAFAKHFGLSDRQVTASLEALVRCNVMDFSSSSSSSSSSEGKGKGRPKRCYRLQDDFHKKLNKASAPSTMHHEAAVGSLLKHENRKAARASEKSEKPKVDVAVLADLRSKRQLGQLSVVNRLLLSVLLCRADRLGVVCDLGSSVLCKVTGLSKEGLKHRVQRLIDQGLIRAYVPGATSSVLFAKMKSVYFLNLNHPELSDEGSTTSVLVCVTGDPFPDRVPDVLHAYRFYSETVLHGGRPKVYGRRPCTPLLDVFEGQPPSFFCVLQMMLEKYAADFLSLHWSDLGVQPFKKWIDAQKWRVLIGKDFRRQKPLSVPETEQMKEIDDQHVVLVEELCHWAHDLAIWIKDLLCQASDASFGTMDFAIIPQPMALGYYRFALLALPRESDDGRSCLVIEPSAGQQYFGRESEIPLEDRYRYGLLTRPGNEGAAA